MIIRTSKKERTKRRHYRIRGKVYGTHERPRLSIFRSNKHIYAQIIDDEKTQTLLSFSTLNPELKTKIKSTWTKESAKKVGEVIAKMAKDKGIKKVVFDRGGNKYHGRISAFAESARACGLEF